jgi:hypothetical protein
MNFEKTTGYITIPDKYVVYTKLNEEGVDPEVNEEAGNEGQKLVWGLQGMQKTLNDNAIEAPQLLSGVNLDDDDEELSKKKSGRGQKDGKNG